MIYFYNSAHDHQVKAAARAGLCRRESFSAARVDCDSVRLGGAGAARAQPRHWQHFRL